MIDSSFIYFLGRFHVLALHLPIGIICAAACLECLACLQRYRPLASAAPYLWLAAAVSAVATVALGYLHAAEGGFSGPSLDAHRALGTGVAALSVLVWIVRARGQSSAAPVAAVAGIALLGLVAATGHYGGNLTHGSTYLVEYAPEPLRRLAGLGAARPPVTDLESADPYHDVVAPLLSRRCGTCHNDSKHGGGLNVSTLEALLRGGETGPVIVRGDAAGSELIRRVTLDRGDEAFMPAEGKTPLTPGQIGILRWWIETGAAQGTSLAALPIDEDTRLAMKTELGLMAAPATGVLAVDAAMEVRLDAAGFVARPLSQTDPLLVVTAAGAQVLGSEALAALAAAAPYVADLNLGRLGLDDAALAALRGFNRLTHLRLDNNALSDAGVAAIGELESLEVLNLYGNSEVSDASVPVLAALPSLRRLYLWGTGVTPAGVAQLRERRPSLDVDDGARVH